MRNFGRTIRPCHLGAGAEVLLDEAQQLAAVVPVLPNAPGPPSDGQIRDQYSDHTTTLDQSEASIHLLMSHKQLRTITTSGLPWSSFILRK